MAENTHKLKRRRGAPKSEQRGRFRAVPRKMSRPNNSGDNHSDQEVARAIEATGGLLTRAAALLGCKPSGLRCRIAANADLKEYLAEVVEARMDDCEDQIVKAIKAGKPWAIQLYIKYKGYTRGYIERKVIGGDDDLPPIKFVYEDA